MSCGNTSVYLPESMASIWKPLKGPLNDWPLTFCDASTVHKSMDLEAADLLYPKLATENFQVYHRPEHKWYYLSGQTTSELIIFRQADSMSGSSPGMSDQRTLTVRKLTQDRRTTLLILQSICLFVRGSKRKH